MTLGEAVAQARKRKDLSLRELAALTGIQNSHLSEMENGIRANPSFRNVVKIARVLKLSLNRLASLSSPPSKGEKE